MIPQAAITHWRNVVPWAQDAQVEQDLILSRALVEIFQDATVSGALLLRGGTALHKLFPGFRLSCGSIASWGEERNVLGATGQGLVVPTKNARVARVRNWSSPTGRLSPSRHG